MKRAGCDQKQPAPEVIGTPDSHAGPSTDDR